MSHVTPEAPIVRQPARRNPRNDPRPGDRIELGGIVWRVLEADESTVSWRVEGMDEAHHCSREHWPRTTKARTVVHRDVKPANVIRGTGSALTEADQDGMRRLSALAPVGTWTKDATAALRDRLGYTRRSWQGFVTRAKAAGALESKTLGARTGDVYRPSSAWLAGPHGESRGRMEGRSGPHGSLLDLESVPKSSDSKKQPTNLPGPHGDERGRMGPHVGPLGDPLDALVLRVAARLERLNVVHSLDGPTSALVREFLDALAHRDAKPHNVMQGQAPTAPTPTPDRKPDVDHAPPVCCSEPMSLTWNPTKRVWFWGCVRWRDTDCPGLSLEEGAARARSAARASEDERRAGDARAAREAQEAADNAAHVARMAEIAEKRRQAKAAQGGSPTQQVSRTDSPGLTTQGREAS